MMKQKRVEEGLSPVHVTVRHFLFIPTLADGSGPLSSSSVPALAGLCLCLSLLLLLLCLLLRLFSSARWARTRRWADAGRDPEDGNQRRHSQQQQQQQGSRKKPPAIMLQGEDAGKMKLVCLT